MRARIGSGFDSFEPRFDLNAVQYTAHEVDVPTSKHAPSATMTSPIVVPAEIVVFGPVDTIGGIRTKMPAGSRLPAGVSIAVRLGGMGTQTLANAASSAAMSILPICNMALVAAVALPRFGSRVSS
jgi:hypothetical protein